MNVINHGHRAAISKKYSLRLLPFYTIVANFYYEKVHRMMHTAIVSNLLKLAGIACAPRPIHATKITFGVKFTLNLFKEAFKM